MGLFKKSGPDIVDLTKLRDKGTLQRSRAIAKQNEQELKNSNDVIDLSNSNNSMNSESSGLGFLSGLAGAEGSENPNVSNNLRAARRAARISARTGNIDD